MIKKIFLFLFSLGMTSFCLSQEKESYEKEYAGAVNLNTNASLFGGFNFRYAKNVGGKNYRLYTIEIVNVRHPKERKYTNPTTGNSFIYFKSNYLLPIRFMYGRKLILFNKAEEEGVGISAILAAGPTLGLVKPYVIQYDYTDYSIYKGDPKDVRNEQFDPQKHLYPQYRILGNAGFFSGLFHSKIVPALAMKSGLCFELGGWGGNVTGIEAGGLLEIYPKKIIIIPGASNRSIYTSIYVNLFFGVRK